jgi:hypothetical protein
MIRLVVVGTDAPIYGGESDGEAGEGYWGVDANMALNYSLVRERN